MCYDVKRIKCQVLICQASACVCKYVCVCDGVKRHRSRRDNPFAFVRNGRRRACPKTAMSIATSDSTSSRLVIALCRQPAACSALDMALFRHDQCRMRVFHVVLYLFTRYVLIVMPAASCVNSLHSLEQANRMRRMQLGRESRTSKPPHRQASPQTRRTHFDPHMERETALVFQ